VVKKKKKKKKEFERVMRVGDGLRRRPQVFSSVFFASVFVFW